MSLQSHQPQAPIGGCEQHIVAIADASDSPHTTVPVACDSIAVDGEEELSSAAEKASSDGVEAKHLSVGSLHEADVATCHLVESLVGAEIETTLVFDAAVAAADGRLPAIDETQG